MIGTPAFGPSVSMRINLALPPCLPSAIGRTGMIWQNVAMVTGLLPVVGAPPPLISYGGTAMLTVFVGLGVVTSACIHDRPAPE